MSPQWNLEKISAFAVADGAARRPPSKTSYPFVPFVVESSAMKKALWTYAALASLVSLAALWLFTFALAPRIFAQFRELGGFEIYLREWPMEAPIRWALRFRPAFWCVVPFAFLPLLAACLPQCGETARRIAGGIHVTFSGLLFLAALWFLTSASMGFSEAALAEHMKLRFNEGILREFLLTETAANRYEQVLQRMATFWGKPVEIRSAEELSPSDRRERLGDLVRLLRQTQDPALKKRLLASAYGFRAEIKPGTSTAQTVLEQASALTGESFPSLDAFFQWLEPQMGHEPWQPIPLYRFESPSQDKH